MCALRAPAIAMPCTGMFVCFFVCAMVVFALIDRVLAGRFFTYLPQPTTYDNKLVVHTIHLISTKVFAYVEARRAVSLPRARL